MISTWETSLGGGGGGGGGEALKKSDILTRVASNLTHKSSPGSYFESTTVNYAYQDETKDSMSSSGAAAGLSDRLFNFLQGEVSLLWIIFGTLGNLLSLAVLLRHKMRIHSTFTYLMLLSVCDTLVLYFGLMRDFLVHKYEVEVAGALLCKLHVFAFYFVLHMASWLLVAVNIDRLIAASFLSLSKKWCTPRMALKVSFFLALALLALNAHFLFFVESNAHVFETKFKLTLVNVSSPINISELISNDTVLLAANQMRQHHMTSRSKSSSASDNTLTSATITEYYDVRSYNELLTHISTLVSSKFSNISMNGGSSTNQDYVNVNGGGNGDGNDGVYWGNAYVKMEKENESTLTIRFFESVVQEPVNPYVYQKCLIKRNYPGYSYFFQHIFTWIDASAQVILPFAIMLICNVNIIHKVLLTKNRTNGRNIKRLRKIKGMCVMIVSVSIIFFILEAPVLIFICLMQGNYISQSWPYIRLMWTLMNLMMYTNHVINFFSYCMTGTKFRRELIKLFYMHKAIRFMSVYKNVNIFTSAAPGQGGGGGGDHHHRHHHRHTHHHHCSHTHHKPALASCSNQQLANEENNYADVNVDHNENELINRNNDVREVNFDFGGKTVTPNIATVVATAAAAAATSAKPGLNVRVAAKRSLGGSLVDRKRNKETNNNEAVAQLTAIDTILIKPTSLTNRIMSKKAQLGESAILSSMKSKKTSRWRKKTTSDENDEDEDEDEDDNGDEEDDLSSSSSSASSLWTPKPKVYSPNNEIDLELDAYYQRSIGGSFKLPTMMMMMTKSTNKTDNNNNNNTTSNAANHVVLDDYHECLVGHRRQALTKDDIDAVVGNSRLNTPGHDEFNLSAAVNGRSSSMFRSLKYKAKSGFKHALHNSERRPVSSSTRHHNNNDHLKDDFRCNNIINNKKKISSHKIDEKKDFDDIDIHIDEISNKEVLD